MTMKTKASEQLEVGTPVHIPGIEEDGVIEQYWKDDRGDMIYKITLYNKHATSTGYFLARRHELMILVELPKFLY